MTTWQTIGRLLRYRSWSLGFHVAVSLLLYGFTVVPALISREIFNLLMVKPPYI